MRKTPNKKIEPFRMLAWEQEHFGFTFVGQANGAFVIPFNGVMLRAVASDGKGWEHVSVSPNKQRTPTWEEMQFIKEQFWRDDEVCWQYHPAASQYVNCHPHTLHIWRCPRFKMKVPPKEFV